jgi:hypothetical protein
MFTRIGFALLPVLICLILPTLAIADGCIFGKNGYIPERSQTAFIEWSSGQERLFVATKADATSEPSVWIIPVPANPEQVKAEPVERFPYVVGPNRLRQLRKHLAETRDNVLWRNFGLPVFFLLGGSKAEYTFSAGADVQVHAHVEKHGMVVEVLTARTPTDLNEYLAGKQLGMKAEQLTSLSTYIGQEYSLICGWKSEAKSTARALRIDFPTPHVFYPMLPSKVYQHHVPTSIMVRGWFRLTKNVGQESAFCETGLWRVREQGNVEDPLGFEPTKVDEKTDSPLEPLTRVEVYSKPSDWQADLTLEPIAANNLAAVCFFATWSEWFSLMLNVILGVLFGLCLPWLLIPNSERRWHDWLVLALIGGSIYLSVYAVAVMIWGWCRLRFAHRQRTTGQTTIMQVFLFLLGLVLILFCTIGAWHATHGFAFWMCLGLVGLSLATVIPVVNAGCCSYRAFGKQAGWLLIFVVLHGALVALICEILHEWLTP